jgi:hypothetical protein
MTTLCFTLNDHLVMRLQEFAASLSSYKKPPLFTLNNLRLRLKNFLIQESLSDEQVGSPLWKQELIFERDQLKDLSALLCQKYVKVSISHKKLVDYFYLLSKSEERFKDWKFRYFLWTDELIFCWKKFLVANGNLDKAFIIQDQLILRINEESSSHPSKSFFLDCLGYRYVLKHEGSMIIDNENQLHKLLHAVGVMKQGLPCAVDSWQNHPVNQIKRQYKKTFSQIIQAILPLYELNQSSNNLEKFKKKISYLFNKSLLLTLKKKCTIPNCKAKQLT